ncbi:hypothetical protein GCM10010129_00230 [Streptomyces fumigatiscleroticus]|nr:hypothetical protein GCM10010129_00230 [Streptomyces fumigatiscleroticus]
MTVFSYVTRWYVVGGRFLGVIVGAVRSRPFGRRQQLIGQAPHRSVSRRTAGDTHGEYRQVAKVTAQPWASP